MVDLWTFGGLSLRELLKRTARESWEDEVFGQAARLAFYHFIAIFPALLLASAILSRLVAGAELLQTLQSSLRTVLPPRASGFVTGFLNQIAMGNARHTLWFAVFGSLWAAFNGTWAVMSALNAAYEVEERRSWWQVTLTAAGLTLTLALLGIASLVVLFLGQRFSSGVSVWFPIVQWPILAVVLLVAFAALYRFGPNLVDREMRWSTPGAVLAGILWLGTCGLFRAYITYQAAKYDQVYGSAGALVILLLWFYFTGAAILIGGELNSEIENAAAQHGHPDPRRPGEHRQGGVPAQRV